MKRILAIAAVLAMMVAACGDSDSESATTEAPATTAAEAEATTEAPTTAAPETEDTGETEDPGDGEAPAGDAIEVELVEWAINAPTEIASGTVTFNVTNSGGGSHEFAIVRGESYETLPQLDNGAIDEDALGADFLGRTETFGGGAMVTTSFDLEPGSYVFVCNISFGPNSHARAGQVLSVTVS